jgi:hypothetical protein
MFRPARAKRGQPRPRGSSSDPPTPTSATLTRRSTSTTISPPRHSGSSSPPRSPLGQPSSTNDATTRRRLRLRGSSTATLGSRPHPALIRRAVTPTGDGRPEHRIGPFQAEGPLRRFSALSTFAGTAPLPFPSYASYPSYPPLGHDDNLRVLPLPQLSRSMSWRRESADYKALGALQTQFMK